jgi:hypothetical protein
MVPTGQKYFPGIPYGVRVPIGVKLEDITAEGGFLSPIEGGIDLRYRQIR